MSNFWKRGVTILFGMPVIVACAYWGGIPFMLLVLALALVSIHEFYNLMKLNEFYPAYWVGSLVTAFFIITAYFATAYFAVQKSWEPAHSAIFTLAVIVTLGLGLYLHRPKNVTADVAVTLFGMIYVGWFYSYFLFIRALSPHGGYVFFLMATIWAEDIAAYMVGRYFGKHKLFPSISPKKSWEGAIAGFLVCLAAAAIFSPFSGIAMVHALILGAIIGIVAPISDLVESIIKRDVGAKDSSELVPGHGGVLDRMDSFILTAPVMYYYIVWIMGALN